MIYQPAEFSYTFEDKTVSIAVWMDVNGIPPAIVARPISDEYQGILVVEIGIDAVAVSATQEGQLPLEAWFNAALARLKNEGQWARLNQIFTGVGEFRTAYKDFVS